MSTRRWFRSVLFVPGHQGDRIGKAARSGADAVLVDLEDAVPISRKDEARHVTATAIGAYDGPVAMMVRLNGWGDGALLEDLEQGLALDAAETVAGRSQHLTAGVDLDVVPARES